MTAEFSRLPHRAVRSYRMQWAVLVRDFLVMLGFTVLVWRYLGDAAVWWMQQLNFWILKTGLLGHAQLLPAQSGDGIAFIPKFAVAAPTFLPTAATWWLTVLGCAALWLYVRWLKTDRLPLIYFVRLLVLVQITALVFFYFWPESIPTSVANFLTDVFRQSAGLMLLVPALFMLTLHLFALPWWVKYASVLAALAFLVLFVPLQAACCAWILQMGGILFMPVLYLFFGLLPQIVALMGFYSFALSLLAPNPTLAQHGLIK
jgi:hypothetical protein